MYTYTWRKTRKKLCRLDLNFLYFFYIGPILTVSIVGSLSTYKDHWCEKGRQDHLGSHNRPRLIENTWSYTWYTDAHHLGAAQRLLVQLPWRPGGVQPTYTVKTRSRVVDTPPQPILSPAVDVKLVRIAVEKLEEKHINTYSLCPDISNSMN